MSGIIFSDLGQASSFMALDWVQASIKQCVGFSAYPATLNVRPKTGEDAKLWRHARDSMRALALPPIDGGFCSARLYPVEIFGAGSPKGKIQAAVLVPEVKNYPSDKLEIIAPMRLKDYLGVSDGDVLTLEFLN